MLGTGETGQKEEEKPGSRNDLGRPGFCIYHWRVTLMEPGNLGNFSVSNHSVKAFRVLFREQGI